MHFFAESKFGPLCAPLCGVTGAGCDMGNDVLQLAWSQIFAERLQCDQSLMPCLEDLWLPWKNSCTEQRDESICQSEVAQASAKAACWRQRLIASFGVWDALFCAVQPMARHEARLRRFCKLFEELWPADSSYDESSLAAAVEKEQTRVNHLVNSLVERISQSANLVSDKEILELLDNLIKGAAGLELDVKLDVVELRSTCLQGDELRVGIQDWLRRVQRLYWCPLDGAARIMFKEVFCAKCSGGLHMKVESNLAGSHLDYIVETPVRHLAARSYSDEPMDNAAVLYRLLECSSSRTVEVADLWKNFCECITSISEGATMPESTLKLRFGHGLLALHTLGLVSPQTGGKSDGDTKFDHWRLRKRHFGRVWLKNQDKQSWDAEAIAALCAVSPAASSTEIQLALRVDASGSQEKKPLPAWAQRFIPSVLRDAGKLPSLLKRQAPARPTGFDPSAKRGKVADKSRPRIFFG
jgi:hypothetical protein